MHQTTDGQKIEVEMIEYLGPYLVDPDKCKCKHVFKVIEWAHWIT